MFQINYPVKWITKQLDSVMSVFLLVSFMCSVFLWIDGYTTHTYIGSKSKLERGKR